MMRQWLRMLVIAGGLSGVCPQVHPQDSPHGDLSVSCDQCHRTDSWNVLASKMTFKHTSTGFPLDGRHSQVACRQCHTTLRFAEAGDQCFTCHQDVHRTELGSICERCHTTDSWLVPDMPQRHISTRFALLGAHRMAQCQSCHVNQQKHTYTGVPLECVSCHRADYDATVAPPHRASGLSTDCESCHSVSALSWGGHFDHGTTGFALVGAHAAVPCAQCHSNKVFKWLSQECYSCHAAEYAATKTPPHSASGLGTDCQNCHSAAATSWGGRFDHATTGFALQGGHAGVPCVQCHANNVYAGLPAACASCHTQEYNATTNPAHAPSGFPTTCDACHTTAAWTPSTFNHDASFPISAGSSHRPGRWTACADCHTSSANFRVFSCLNCHEHAQSNVDPRHRNVSGYRYESQACYSCHPRGRQ